jgi:ComF family protein
LAGAASRLCGACLAQPPAFDETTTLADYRPPVSGMVAALKFAARIDLATAFARLLAARDSARPPAELVIAVPLAFERERERGFNQALEIARAYARLAKIPLAERLVVRVRHGAAQLSLAREDRLRNVRGAFALAGPVAAQRVVVIDDVMTTGATLGEVARVLKKAGVSHVTNRVIARTP